MNNYAVFIAGFLLLSTVSGQNNVQSSIDGSFARFNTDGYNIEAANEGVLIPDLPWTNITSFTFETWHAFSGADAGGGLANQPTIFCGNANSYFYFTSFNGSYTGGIGRLAGVLKWNMTTVGSASVSFFFESSNVHISFTLNGANSFLTLLTTAPSAVKTTYVTPFNFDGDFSTLAGAKCTLATSAYPGVVYPAEIAGPMAGSLDETRIWFPARTQAEVENNRFSSLNGNEPNLQVYYNFDGATGTLLPDVSINNRDGTLTSGYDKLPQDQNIFGTEAVANQITILTKVDREIEYDGSVSANVFLTSANTNLVSKMTQEPTFGKVCDRSISSAATCEALNVTDTITSRPSPIIYFPEREGCGTTQVFSITPSNSNSGVSGDAVSFNIKVNPLAPLLNNVSYTLPALGGTLNIQGSGFGLPGSLVGSESVTVTINGNDVECTNAVVNSNRNTISCQLQGGVGFGSISVTVCGVTPSVTPVFNYQAPTITFASVNSSDIFNNNTFIFIYGKNFGPQKTLFIPDAQNFVSLNNTACNVQFLNDTNIICQLTYNFDSGRTYPLRVSLGGQSVTFPFNYTLCGKPCQNGGKCIGFNKCDCRLTGFEGDDCTSPLVCSPECQNGGVCKENSDTASGGLSKLCVCTAGWEGVDCSSEIKEESNTTPVGLIAGLASGGGVGILLLGAAVVYLLIFRKPKRGTKNFIPLEKKDFTKIIYGEQLNQTPEKTNANLDELEKLLVQDDLKLAFAVSNITQITEADQIAKAMVIVFQDNNKALSLLDAFVDEEVKSTESAGTLFRSNSMVSKMFKFYSRMIGLPYLYVTVGPELDEIITKQLGIEVDPEKMEEGADYDEMRWMLMAYSQKILVQILKSSEGCPVQFRTLFEHLKHVVGNRFPENVNTTIGGFIFLRFFCPAISSPEAYGILEEPPTPSARRLLILITKVLQNLSNDVEFGSKEPYMAKMNDFIQSNRSKLAEFYDKLIKPTNKANTDVTLPPNMKKIQLTVLAHHIRTCLDQIEDKELKQKLDTIV